jgi:ABC-type antimicrobial peptide transport system permease subunit
MRTLTLKGLSVHERTTELGLLRAVGMQRRQLRRRMVVILGLAGLAGVVAATGPARRAAKLNVLEAISSE